MDRADAPVFTKSASAVFALAVGLFVAARLWHFTAYSLWTDEIFSLLIARHDWSSLLAYVVEDIFLPPLFFLLLKLWIAIGGESLPWLKLFPVLTSFATIIPFFLLCRELKLRAAEINLALMLMAVNGYLIYYAQELRMYSLLVFFAVCSLWLFLRFFNCEVGNRKHLVALFVVNLLLVYTQYFGWLVVGAEFIFLLFWGRRKLPAFTISAVCLILCFSPWAYAVAQAAIRKEDSGRLIAWIKRPDLSNLLEYYAILNGPFDFRFNTYVRFLLCGSPILLWAWCVLRKDREDKERVAAFWGLFLFSFLPVALTYSVNQILARPVWHPRYLIIVAVPYMILLAVAVHRLRPKWIRTATILLVGGWATLAGFKELNRLNLWRLGDHKVAWEALTRRMMEAESPQEANSIKVYAFGWTVAIPMQFYLDEARERRFQVVLVDSNDTTFSREIIDLPLWNYDKNSSTWVYDKDSTELDVEHFWVAFRNYNEKQVEGILTDRAYQVGEGFGVGPSSNKIILAPVWRR